ncbi:MAG: hypothetical protein QM790_17575 [Nibricoccus sp.]
MRDERLEDALKYIDELLELLKNYVSTNDTPEGRTKFELRWFKQEIEGGRLTTLPALREQSSTLRHVYGEEYLKNIDIPRQKRLKKLISLLSSGHYLMKPPFYPLVIEEIEKMRALLVGVEPAREDIPLELINKLQNTDNERITAEEKRRVHRYVLRDLDLLRARFADQTIESPPVNWDDYRGMSVADQNSIFSGDKSSPEDRQWERLVLLIFEGLRPDPEGKIRNRRW